MTDQELEAGLKLRIEKIKKELRLLRAEHDYLVSILLYPKIFQECKVELEKQFESPSAG